MSGVFLIFSLLLLNKTQQLSDAMLSECSLYSLTSVMNYIQTLQACYPDSDCWISKVNSRQCGSGQNSSLKQMWAVCKCLKAFTAIHKLFSERLHWPIVAPKKTCCYIKLEELLCFFNCFNFCKTIKSMTLSKHPI